jgi:Zn-dependent peptidase ImmA (M78 family)
MPVFAVIFDEPLARHEMRYAPLVMSWERVGERLRRALVAKPTDRSVLATSARIPELELAALERGEATKVSTGALARLARELSLPPTALWSEDPQTDIELSLRFRHASVPDFFHADESVARRAILDARKLAELDALLGRKTFRTFFEPRPVAGKPYEDGYNRAREIRRLLAKEGVLQTDYDPLPANLDALVEDFFGIPVVDAPLNTSGVLALTAKDEPTTAVAIVVNTAAIWSTKPLRRRVDVSHELAHALFDAPAQALSVWIDKEDEVTTAPHKLPADQVEQRARAVAAELLLPRDGLRELLGPPPAEHASIMRAVDMVQRAQARFLSSTELTAHHLQNRGYFPKHLHEEVVRSAAPLDVGMVPKREPVLVRRTRQALEDGVLTAMAAREILGLPAWAKLPTAVI